MRPEMTKQAQAEIERMWKLRREAVTLLGVVVAEWKSDPASVACFDLRVVERAKTVVAELEKLESKHSRY